MPNSKDPTSIGAILVAMGVITADQLEEAVREQEKERLDILLGKILLANGIISQSQLEAALTTQKGLRSKKKHQRAMAQSQIAECGVGSIMAMASSIKSHAREAREKITGTAFPVMTAEMLNKKSG